MAALNEAYEVLSNEGTWRFTDSNLPCFFVPHLYSTIQNFVHDSTMATTRMTRRPGRVLMHIHSHRVETHSKMSSSNSQDSSFPSIIECYTSLMSWGCYCISFAIVCCMDLLCMDMKWSLRVGRWLQAIACVVAYILTIRSTFPSIFFCRSFLH